MIEYRCAECGDSNLSVMLHDDLWNSISNGELLCLLCIEHRLKREVTLLDLKECGFTRTIRTFVIRERIRHD